MSSRDSILGEARFEGKLRQIIKDRVTDHSDARKNSTLVWPHRSEGILKFADRDPNMGL
jgi:hypothetical protein